MVRWRDERDDESERDWWEEDEEEEEYGGYRYGGVPYGWSTIMGIPYPIAIDIMRGKWPPQREDSGLFNHDSAFGDAGNLFDNPFGDTGNLFDDPFGGGGDFFGGGMDL
mgnify:CR=1 FL=1